MPPGWEDSYVDAINNGGQLAMNVDNSNGLSHAFLYSEGSWTDLGTLGDPTNPLNGACPKSINSAGEIVGGASSSNFSDHAFVFSNGTMVDLNGVVNPTSGWTLEQANGINDSGEIVGYGTNSLGNRDAFLLKPLPPGDANGDGKVDVNDLTVVLTDLGESAGMSSR